MYLHCFAVLFSHELRVQEVASEWSMHCSRTLKLQHQASSADFLHLGLHLQVCGPTAEGMEGSSSRAHRGDAVACRPPVCVCIRSAL